MVTKRFGRAADSAPGPGAPVLQIEGLRHVYGARQGSALVAVDGVDLHVAAGEVLALVGESGSGKTTLAQCAVRLLEPSEGRIMVNGNDITHLDAGGLRPFRRQIRMVMQDPRAAFNPRMTVGQALTEPLRINRLADRSERIRRAAEMLEMVGLRPALADRHIHELSGGQLQRVGIGRAIILRPSLLVADELISALDVSVRASVLNLLSDLQSELGFGCLFVTHDLVTAEYFADRVAVMRNGLIVETGPASEIFGRPQHPYTVALLGATPIPDPTTNRRRRPRTQPQGTAV